jgi:hypothetical protein
MVTAALVTFVLLPLGSLMALAGRAPSRRPAAVVITRGRRENR